MSDVLTTIMFLSSFFGFILFYLIQSRIGEEQERERHQFAEANPHLEAYLRRCPAYQNFYSNRPLKKVTYTGGMTEEQKKSSLKKCGPDTTLV